MILRFCLSLLSLGSLYASSSSSRSGDQKRYLCEDNLCKLLTHTSSQYSDGISQQHCLLICGTGQLWPYPRNQPHIGQSVTPISLKNIQIVNDLHELEDLLNSYQQTFYDSIASTIPKSRLSNNGYHVKVMLNIESADLQLDLSTDETYSLTTKVDNLSETVQVSIVSKTYYGARHGLETLSQLIVWDNLQHSLIIASDYHIELDGPSFPYRGVMLDLSRHYLSPDVIKRTIRAMSYNKMNLLHLHLSDTASFPLEIVNQPNLTLYGAYSDEEQITHIDAIELFHYAKAHGVIIMPEIDTPAHVSAGWQWGPAADLGDLILCSDPDGTSGTQWASDALEPPSGQLNLANSNIYPILKEIYADIIQKFATSSGIIHLGGDEVIVGSDESWAACYNSSSLGQPILQLLTELGLSRTDPESFYLLWQNFTKMITKLAVDSFAEINPNLTPSFHFWGGAGESQVTYNLITRPDVVDILPPDLFTIQVWDDSAHSISKTLIRKGYSIVLSNTDYVYLDCGNAGWSNAGGYWCQPYHEWYHIYQYVSDIVKKWELSEAQVEKVLLISSSPSLLIRCRSKEARPFPGVR